MKGKQSLAGALLSCAVATSAFAQSLTPSNYGVNATIKGTKFTGEFQYESDGTMTGNWASSGCVQSVNSIGVILNPQSYYVVLVTLSGKCKVEGVLNFQPTSDSDFTIFNQKGQHQGIGTVSPN